MYKVKPKAANQFAQVDKDAVPFAVMVSPDELEAGEIIIKPQSVSGQDQGEGGKGIKMKRTEMVPWLLERLGRK